MEFLTNQDNYKPFFFGQKDYNDEIKQTLDNKSYANCISDMMANALSNTTKTTAVVWEKENGQLVQRNVIIPALDANPVNGIIHLHKEGQHFEPIVKRQQKEISDALSSTHGLSLQQTQALSSIPPEDFNIHDHQISSDKEYAITKSIEGAEERKTQEREDESIVTTLDSDSDCVIIENAGQERQDESIVTTLDSDSDCVIIENTGQEREDKSIVTTQDSDSDCVIIENAGQGNGKYVDRLNQIKFDSKKDIQIPGITSEAICYLDGDKRFPFWKIASKPLETLPVAESIHYGRYDRNKLCQSNPNFVNANCSFLVNTDNMLNAKDIFCDLHGHWERAGTKRMNCVPDKGRLVKIPEGEIKIDDKTMVKVKRAVYYHRHHRDFHKVIVTLDSTPISFLQYYFDDKPKNVFASHPHGNSHSDDPYTRTKVSVLDYIKDNTEKPKKLVSKIYNDAGGFLGVEGPNELVRNSMQIYNINRSLKVHKDELIEVRDLYQREKACGDMFIRELSVIPEVSVFVSSDQQLLDIERFCTKNTNFSVLGVDATFNLGQYFVTLTTYRHLMFEN
ncbi:uncharacterized protein [Clytia hemisphaerica]